MDDRELAIYERLDTLGIAFERYEHEASVSMDDCFRIGESIGCMHCKNLFLCNRSQTEFYLLLIEGSKRFRTATVSKLLGISRLSFATSEHMSDKLNVKPGAVTPLGLMFNRNKDVRVVIDSDVLKHEHVLVHPCISTASIKIRVDDLMRFINSLVDETVTIDIPCE